MIYRRSQDSSSIDWGGAGVSEFALSVLTAFRKGAIVKPIGEKKNNNKKQKIVRYSESTAMPYITPQNIRCQSVNRPYTTLAQLSCVPRKIAYPGLSFLPQSDLPLWACIQLAIYNFVPPRPKKKKKNLS